MTELLQQLANAATLGSLYVLVALSITLIFGLTGIVNFAVGDLLVLGAFVTYALNTGGVPFIPAAALATLAMAVTGLGLERVAFRWTLPQPQNGFIVSLGLILVIQSFVVLIWGSEFRNMGQPLPQTLHIGKVVIGAQNLAVLGVALLAMALLVAWLYRTRDGRALRAASEDRETAQLMGIPTKRLTALAFSIGVGLAGLAGAMVASVGVIYPFLSSAFLLKGFAIATIGGLGSLAGAFIAGIMVALIETLSAQYLPVQWIDAYVFGAMLVILLIRPSGLFGVQRG
jgi:branched-chain amino acid transport system permease protein